MGGEQSRKCGSCPSGFLCQVFGKYEPDQCVPMLTSCAVCEGTVVLREGGEIFSFDLWTYYEDVQRNGYVTHLD